MRRLNNSMVIFTFVMIAGLAMSTVVVRAEDNDDAVHIESDGNTSLEDIEAGRNSYYANLAAQYETEEKSSNDSSTSSATQTAPKTNNANSTSQKVSSAPKYTEAEIEAAWSETERTDATCSKDGVITYKNSLTGKTKIETIPATGEHSYILSGHVDSTCINNGYDTYTCTVCGDSYSEGLPLAEHTEGEVKVIKLASSFSEGESKVYCSVCDEVIRTDVIPQTCPLPLSIVIAFGAGFIVLIFGVLSLVLRKND